MLLLFFVCLKKKSSFSVKFAFCIEISLKNICNDKLPHQLQRLESILSNPIVWTKSNLKRKMSCEWEKTKTNKFNWEWSVWNVLSQEKHRFILLAFHGLRFWNVFPSILVFVFGWTFFGTCPSHYVLHAVISLCISKEAVK